MVTRRIGSALAGGIAAALLSAPAVAGPAEQDGVRAGCLASLNWEASRCDCLAEQAGTLSDDQQAFVAASLNDRHDEASALKDRMTVPEAAQAAMFLPMAGRTCHGG